MHDLVIRNGMVVDGTGLPAYRADVGVSGDRIAAIGRIRERGKEEIDATGQVVSPGFIDGHTHMDAQVFWDPLGSCSCWHGVTTAVMGNCGFTLAPGAPEQREMILSNIIRAEDISADAIGAAVPWNWTSFREYMDVVDKLPKAINYAANIGHSALRTHVMGARAFEQKASADDMGAMEHELLDALDAGAIGFTSSLSSGAQAAGAGQSAGRIESRVLGGARSARVHDGHDRTRHLRVCARAGVAVEGPERAQGRQRSIARPRGEERRPHHVRYSGRQRRHQGQPRASGQHRASGRPHVRADAHPRHLARALVQGAPSVRRFPRVGGRARTADRGTAQGVLAIPRQRKRLVEATKKGGYRTGGGEPRAPDYGNMYVVYSAVSRNPTVAELAAKRNVDPVEVMMDLALESDFNQLFMQFDEATVPKSEEEALATLRHPRTVMTFSDSGAHVSLIMDSSIHTHLLAYWMRERGAFSLEEAVKMITLTPAVAWGFTDRGLLRQGCIADLNVFDPADDRAADPDDRIRSADRCAEAEAEVERHHGDRDRGPGGIQERRAHGRARREAAEVDSGGRSVALFKAPSPAACAP